jgi:hypothetical protein
MRKLFFLSAFVLLAWIPAAAQDPALLDPFKTSGKVISFNRLHDDGITYGGLMSLEDGRFLIEGPNWDASLAHDGFATIDTWEYEKKDRYFFVDEDGRKAFGGRAFEGAGTFSEGKVFVAQEGRIQCMDTAGKILFTLPEDALFALPFREGYAFYKAESGWWLVDQKGRHVFQESFANAQPFVSNGRVVVLDGKTGLWGILSVEGRQILPFKYKYLGCQPQPASLPEWVRVLGGPLMPFATDGEEIKWGILEVATGKQIVKPAYYMVTPEKGGFSFWSDEQDLWLDGQTRKFAKRPEDPELPAPLKGVYAPSWTFPITGTDLYVGRRESDMKSVIVQKDGKVVVPARGITYPFLADKEQMSPDYLSMEMGCATAYASSILEGYYMDGDGDMGVPDLTSYDPDDENLYDSDAFLDWIVAMYGAPADTQDFSYNLKDIFLGGEPMKGILGNDRKEIRVWFTGVESTDKGFVVKGKSSVAGGASCNFGGELTMRTLAHTPLEGGKEVYMLFGESYLDEAPGQKGSGVFEGVFLYYLEQAGDGKLVLVKDRSLPLELGYDMNKTFVGTWTSHRTGTAKRCNWSDGFVPFSQPYK